MYKIKCHIKDALMKESYSKEVQSLPNKEIPQPLFTLRIYAESYRRRSIHKNTQFVLDYCVNNQLKHQRWKISKVNNTC